MIYINGRYLTKVMTGVVRYATEIVSFFDVKENKDKITVLLPKNATCSFKYLPTKKIGKLKGNLWEQISLANFMKKHKDDKLLNLCNSSPLSVSGYTVIHDLTFLLKPRTYSLPFTMWYKYLIPKKAKKDKAIITISNVSKEDIIKHYQIPSKKIHVAYCGGDSPLPIIDETILDTFNLKNKEYYLFVGSNFPHKNINLIYDLAKVSKDKHFVIVSQDYQAKKEDNVTLINQGIKNRELKALYTHAEALILLSSFEGFGMPPLEALVNGTKNIILSDIPIFREIYGDEPTYIDITKPIKEFPLLKKLPENYLNTLLDKYSWKRSSDIILKTIEEDKL